jgi:hypothetical protein
MKNKNLLFKYDVFSWLLFCNQWILISILVYLDHISKSEIVENLIPYLLFIGTLSIANFKVKLLKTKRTTVNYFTEIKLCLAIILGMVFASLIENHTILHVLTYKEFFEKAVVGIMVFYSPLTNIVTVYFVRENKNYQSKGSI